MVLLYRPDGSSVEKEAVDARECIERLGYTFQPPEPIQPPEQEAKIAIKRGRPKKVNDGNA
jgi:hypothetical protein